jgi:hypothetical protein
MIRRLIAGLAAMLLLAACGMLSPLSMQQPTPIPTLTPTLSATQNPSGAQVPTLGAKQSGNLSVQIFSKPNPPIQGGNTLETLITDSNGQPVTDATVTFDLNMTNMNHGENIVTASSLGAGRYSGHVSFLMPGPWRVIVGIAHAGQTNTVRFDFTVN